MGYIVAFILGLFSPILVFLGLECVIAPIYHRCIGDYDDWKNCKGKYQIYARKNNE